MAQRHFYAPPSRVSFKRSPTADNNVSIPVPTSSSNPIQRTAVMNATARSANAGFANAVLASTVAADTNHPIDGQYSARSAPLGPPSTPPATSRTGRHATVETSVLSGTADPARPSSAPCNLTQPADNAAVAAPRTGFATTNSTPIAPRGIHDLKTSEQVRLLEPRLKEEIIDNIMEVPIDEYIKAALYPSSERMPDDLQLARTCLDALQNKVSQDQDIKRLLELHSPPSHTNDAFPKLDKEVKLESEQYGPLCNLFNFVAAYFRRQIPEADAAWPVAVDPRTAASQDNQSSKVKLLRRTFVDTHTLAPKTTGITPTQYDPKPDINLVIHSLDLPDKLTAVHWKDIKISIEVKNKDAIDLDTVLQISRYARGVMNEQCERNYFFTVFVSKTECRVFQWDRVGAHVSKPIDIHKQADLFIWVIGRLATMTPVELGYDEAFSNAGRELSSDRLPKTLTVKESPIRQYLDSDSRPEPLPSKPLLLELDKVLFGFKDLLFNRATRVWRAFVIEDAQKWERSSTVIVKQCWNEDTRPNEGYLLQRAKGIKGIAQLVRMQECDHTFDYHKRFSSHVVGVLGVVKRRGKGKAANQSQATASTEGLTLERVLCRIVTDKEGRSLDEARDSLEVLSAAAQWIKALIDLDEVGIIHRDISYGNLLLPLTNRADDYALVTDLGLAHLKPGFEHKDSSSVPDPTSSSPSQSSSLIIRRKDQPHDHLSGTLPFIAYDLLTQLVSRGKLKSIPQALRHDVESVYWTLFYFALYRGGPNVDEAHQVHLEQLSSNSVADVTTLKAALLLERRRWEGDIGGLFGSLKPFFQAFAMYYKRQDNDDKLIDPIEILNLVNTHRNLLEQALAATPVISLQAPTIVRPTTPPSNPATLVGVPLNRLKRSRPITSQDGLLRSGDGIQPADGEPQTPSKRKATSRTSTRSSGSSYTN
ncbi:hypothetical protein FRB90_010648 [Tulasnella sp. 427]|nr:hypothetical protein FRB90_010648 [Tulasnella sp. 427]